MKPKLFANTTGFTSSAEPNTNEQTTLKHVVSPEVSGQAIRPFKLNFIRMKNLMIMYPTASREVSFNLQLITFVLCLLLPLTAASQVVFYVSSGGNDQWTGKHASAIPGDGPLASVQAAVDRVRADFLSAGGKDYRVVLREGTYSVSEVIEITHEDAFRISFEAYPGEKPVISAGRKITGWKRSRINGVNCWKVNLPEVKRGDYYFRQLFVNGERAMRPRLPKTGFYLVEDPLLGKSKSQGEQLDLAARDRFIFRAGDIKQWKNLQDVNVMALHYWQEDYLPIKEVNLEKREVVFSAKSFMPFVLAHPLHGCGNAWYYADNVFEALNSPGEWYLDRPTGDLYYIPRPGERIQDAEVFAPVITQVFRVEGNVAENKYVNDVHFKGISFRHNEIVWNAHYGTGNGFSNSGPAFMRFHAAKDCSVSECEFRNLGEYAIEISGDPERIYIAGNHFTDLGAGAIKINSGSHLHITDNEIHNGGRVFHSAVAVLSGDLKYSRFLHNHISDFYYNGIVCGGGRRSQHEGKPGSYDNLIMNNHIHTLGQGWLSDMGGIYIPGLQPGMIISGNIVHNIQSACYGGNAVYLDDACENVIVEKNLLYNTSNAVVNFKGKENIVRNNILAFGGQALLRRASSNLDEMSIVNVYKNILLANDHHIHRTTFSIPAFSPGYWSDLNVIWNLGRGPLTVGRPLAGGGSEVAGLDEWIKHTRNDLHSVVADPLLRDPLNGDFTLDPASVAHTLGIDPGSFDQVGPRPKEEWELTRTVQMMRERSGEGHVE